MIPSPVLEGNWSDSAKNPIPSPLTSVEELDDFQGVSLSNRDGFEPDGEEEEEEVVVVEEEPKDEYPPDLEPLLCRRDSAVSPFHQRLTRDTRLASSAAAGSISSSRRYSDTTSSAFETAGPVVSSSISLLLFVNSKYLRLPTFYFTSAKVFYSTLDPIDGQRKRSKALCTCGDDERRVQ